MKIKKGFAGLLILEPEKISQKTLERDKKTRIERLESMKNDAKKGGRFYETIQKLKDY